MLIGSPGRRYRRAGMRLPALAPSDRLDLMPRMAKDRDRRVQPIGLHQQVIKPTK
ncbi:MAG: hypothetical protein ACYC61_18655 [Isosphaeraceae bacterium]